MSSASFCGIISTQNIYFVINYREINSLSWFGKLEIKYFKINLIMPRTKNKSPDLDQCRKWGRKRKQSIQGDSKCLWQTK